MVEPLAKKRKTEKRKWFAPDEVFLKVWGETIVPETNRRQQEVQDSLTHRKAVPVVEFDVGEDERDEEYTPEGERELLEDEAVLYAEWVANTLVAGHALLPVIQTADGEHANVAAWKNKRFGEQLQKANQRLLKFAAGASMSQQPMDLSYGFMTLRGAYKGERLKKALRRPAPVWLERALAATDTAGGMAASSRRTFSDAFHGAHYLLPFAFAPEIIGRGFENIYPALSVNGLMMQWPGWSELSERVATDFLACVPEIITAYTLHDMPDELELESILADVDMPPWMRDLKQQHQAPVNHGRAMLFNTDRVNIERDHITAMAELQSRRDTANSLSMRELAKNTADEARRVKNDVAEEAKRVKKAAVEEAKRVKGVAAQEAKRVKKAAVEEAKRVKNAVIAEPKGGKRKRKLSSSQASEIEAPACSNSIFCSARYSPDTLSVPWICCGAAGCSVQVCGEPACVAALTAHRSRHSTTQS